MDEIEVEVCLWCRAEKDQDQMKLQDIPVWGLQWVCKGHCGEADQGGSNSGDTEANEDHKAAGDRR